MLADASASGAGLADSGGGSNLDKVRDLLFGAEVRRLVDSQRELDERLTSAIASLRGDMLQHLQDMQRAFEAAINSLNDLLQQEAARLDADVRATDERLGNAKADRKLLAKLLAKMAASLDDKG